MPDERSLLKITSPPFLAGRELRGTRSPVKGQKGTGVFQGKAQVPRNSSLSTFVRRKWVSLSYTHGPAWYCICKAPGTSRRGFFSGPARPGQARLGKQTRLLEQPRSGKENAGDTPSPTTLRKRRWTEEYPSLATPHLMLLQHLTEAGIPLRDPPVEFGHPHGGRCLFTSAARSSSSRVGSKTTTAPNQNTSFRREPETAIEY